MKRFSDLITDEPEENGITPEENAIAKAKFYGQYFEVVICNDSDSILKSLALDDVRQPGLNGTPMQMDRLSDEEMIDKASSKRFEGWSHREVDKSIHSCIPSLTVEKQKTVVKPVKSMLEPFFVS